MQSESQAGERGVQAAARAKYRVRFSKAGDLRFVSHHDLMHCFERMFRRAALPVPQTQGFNPRPRMWFASALALGIVGCNEVFELELTEALPAEEVERRLAAQAPPGLTILGARALEPRAAAQVRRAFYCLALAEPPADLRQRCAEFLAKTQVVAQRLRPERRCVNIRPYVDHVTPTDAGLELAIWVTPNGSARPDEVIAALGLAAALDAGGVIERTHLEIVDELPPEAARQPGPALPNAEPAMVPPTADDTVTPAPSARTPTAILTGPLSFDS